MVEDDNDIMPDDDEDDEEEDDAWDELDDAQSLPSRPRRRGRALTYAEGNSFARRLAMVANLAGSGQALANRARISRRVIGKYLSGDADPSRSRLVAMADVAGVSVDWLATGRGPMYASGTSDPSRDGGRGRPPMDKAMLGTALDTIESGLWMLRDELAEAEAGEKRKKEPGYQPSHKELFKEWLDLKWTQAPEREKMWFEMQWEIGFPDFLAWMKQQMSQK